MDYWTRWYNTDSPSQNDGDVETVESIESRLTHGVCSTGFTATRAHCKDAVTGETFSEESPLDGISQILREPCTVKGVECLNEDQVYPINQCSDYAIQFFCKYTDDSDYNVKGTNIFQDFDARIYFILAIVPVGIFLLRLFWGCIFRRRRARRRLQRRAARLRGRSNSQCSSVSDADSISINAELANPPPSYLELFGETPPEHNPRPIFVIGAENMSVCPHCIGKSCTMSSDPRLPRISVTEAPPVNTDNRTLDLSEDQGKSNTNSSLQVPGSQSQSRRTSTISIEMDSLEGATASVSETDTCVTNEQTSEASEQTITELPILQDHQVSSGDSELQQNHSAHTVNLAIVSSASSTCRCHCHRRVSLVTATPFQYDNLGFSRSEDQNQTHYTGMHVSPFQGLHRNLSNLSVVTLTELPSYEDALEIIKKKEQGPDKET